MITRRRFLGGCGSCALSAPFASLLGLSDALAQTLRESAPAAKSADDVERWTRSVCDLCGLGEPIFLRAQDGKLAAVKGIAASRAGFGRLCLRARAIVDAASAADRALQPLLRRDPSTKGTLEGLEAVSWDEALAAAAAGWKSVRDRLGPSGLVIAASDTETCETFLRLAQLARVGLGTDHLDTPARLDALHAYDACAEVFGVAANPSSVEDIDAAGLIVLIGGDITDSHPGVYYRVLDARRTGHAKVVLVDSRRTLAAAIADVHVRPQPGQELAIMNELAAALLGRARRGGVAGVAKQDVDAIADAWRGAKGVVTLVGPVALGTFAGASLARAVARLHRATGQWGAAGKGCLFLPRGANAAGVVALGVRPGRLPAGGKLGVAADREKVAAAWGVKVDALPAAPGLPILAWPAAVRDGKIGAIFALRANVAAELPDAAAWRDALRQCFTVAASTHVPTETTVFADVVLPLALVAGESTGTTMTLDRRCELLEAAVDPPGDARDAESMLTELAGVAVPEELRASFTDAAGEWERWRTLARGTGYEAGGITTERLRRELDVAWPCAAEDQPGTTRLAPAAAATSTARASYVAPAMPPTRAGSAAERTFPLIVGPLVEHERSRVRTGRAADLHYEAPAARLEMHPTDGSALGLAEGDWVTLTSEAGSATARLWLTDRVLPGTLFLPEHYGFVSDVQGGNLAQKEPEGLAWLLVPGDVSKTDEAPAGLPVAVTIQKAHRRDMRRTGL